MQHLERFEIYHEIGHAIIGLIFNGYLMKVEKIILNKDDIKELGRNINDLAYTHQKNVVVEQAIIDKNESLYAMINGLNFLAGIAGATYLSPVEKPQETEVTSNNFNEILHIEGSGGDFDYINGKEIMYSWYLFEKKKFTDEYAYEVHSLLMNVLQEIFLDDRIRMVSKDIYDFIIANPNTNVELEKLNELFPQKLQVEFRNEYIENFKNGFE